MDAASFWKFCPERSAGRNFLKRYSKQPDGAVLEFPFPIICYRRRHALKNDEGKLYLANLDFDMNSPAEYWFVVAVATILVVFVIWQFLDGIVTHFVEPVYMSIAHKPLYVHYYPRRRKLSHEQLAHLSKISFFRRLSDKQRMFFEHRTASFLGNYEFHGKGGMEITDEMRISVASVYVMLTFGMRHYLTDGFSDIILYPDIYQSQLTGEWHKGEFNPRYKVVVFSWKDFRDGLEPNDNLNLGIHEFAHVLHLTSRKRHNNSAAYFSVRLDRILKEVNHPPNRTRLETSGYFRDYAYTDQYEFLAVILEHFFETPQEFRRQFPELHLQISRMINVNVV